MPKCYCKKDVVTDRVGGKFHMFHKGRMYEYRIVAEDDLNSNDETYDYWVIYNKNGADGYSGYRFYKIYRNESIGFCYLRFSDHFSDRKLKLKKLKKCQH